ncbi:DUF4351 domain-containing protein [Pseudoduganella sp. OTU4001]|uniref:DUF4351 domain-containing protein n=1 Tax=Pseudoduganella sp. OTU4001 TaxID=3043854 RepID=UPI00313C874F
MIDWSQRPRFRDKELAQIGFGDALGGMVADKLVEVCLRDSNQWVLLHIEVQAQYDANLPRRIFDYNYRIFKEYGREVASLALLADEDPNWRPQDFHIEALGTTMGISFASAKLLDYDNGYLHDSNNPFALITLAHLRSQQERHDADALLAAKWHLTRLLYEHGWSTQRIIVLFKVINGMMALQEPQQARYWHSILKLEKERKMEWITPLEQSFMDKGWQKGLQHGLEQGREQGSRDGAADLLARQLTQRFGPLPQAVRKRLHKATMEQLEAWSDAMPEAQMLKQVFE